MSGAGKMGDRGGGREGRQKSLNKSKQLKHAIEKGKVLAERPGAERPKFSPAAQALEEIMENVKTFDAANNLTSRQFATDFNGVIRRARHSGVGGFVVLIGDANRVDEDIKMLLPYSGVIYYSLGLSPDVIRKNEKFSDARLNALIDHFYSPACVAMCFGLDFSRDSSTHGQQIKLFQSQLSLANQIKLPVIFKCKQAEKELVELFQQFCADNRSSSLIPSDSEFQPPRVAIHAFNGTEAELKLFIDAGFFIMINGFICDVRAVPVSESSASASNNEEFELSGLGLPLFRLIRSGSLPLDRLLICSDSPHSTPQNIPDAHIRSSRNEPANLPFIVSMLASAYKISSSELEKISTQNSLKFFQIKSLTAAQKAEAEKAAEENKKLEAGNAKAKKEKAAKKKGNQEENELETENPLESKESLELSAKKKFAAAENEKANSSDEEEDKSIEGEILQPSGGGRRNQRVAFDELSSDSDSEFLKKGKSKRKGKKKGNAKVKSAADKNSTASNNKSRRARNSDEENEDGNELEELVKNEIQALEIGGAEENKRNQSEEKNIPSAAASGPLLESANFSFSFACKKCRRVLFSGSDLISHFGAQETSNSAILRDFASCDSLFVKTLASGKQPQQQTAERVECECGAKIGRVKRIQADGAEAEKSPSLDEENDSDESDEENHSKGSRSSASALTGSLSHSHLCSCGRPSSSSSSHFILSRDRLDFLPVVDHLKGPRSIELEFSALEAAKIQQEEINRLTKKEAERIKKMNKKVKKMTRDDQRGNFTEFRNKTLVNKKQTDKIQE